MIKIYEQNGRAFVWNIDDIHILRTRHRIVGSLIGCFPRQSFQNTHKWLPLQLIPEEAALLSEKNIAEILSSLSVEKTPDPEAVKNYWSMRNELCQQQIAKLKEARARTILEKADLIYEGKKRKLSEKAAESSSKRIKKNCDSEKTLQVSTICKNAAERLQVIEEQELTTDSTSQTSSEIIDTETSLDSEQTVSSVTAADEEQEKKAIIEKELSRVPNVGKDNCLVQLFTECLWKKTSDLTSASWDFPRTNEEKIRYAVFKDLWEKGFYLTSGTKFGGDFLVYAGDPIKYHALYIVLCIDREQSFQAQDVVVYGRLGNQVKKTVVLASVGANNSVSYISLKWASELG